MSRYAIRQTNGFDRTVYSISGITLLVTCINSRSPYTFFKALLGGLLIYSGIAGKGILPQVGWPMNRSNNIFNILKQFKPGSPIPPYKTEQPLPKYSTNPSASTHTLCDELAIR